jgi:hypothetical protein
MTYLTFYPQEKLALPLIRVEKNFFEIVRKGYDYYEKKRNFELFSELLCSTKGKKLFSEKQIFRDISKKVLFWEKLFWYFLTHKLCPCFESNAKLCFL